MYLIPQNDRAKLSFYQKGDFRFINTGKAGIKINKNGKKEGNFILFDPDFFIEDQDETIWGFRSEDGNDVIFVLDRMNKRWLRKRTWPPENVGQVKPLKFFSGHIKDWLEISESGMTFGISHSDEKSIVFEDHSERKAEESAELFRVYKVSDYGASQLIAIVTAQF